MRANEIECYQIDSKTFSATCGHKPLSLYESAHKASVISHRSLGFFQRIYYLALDLLATFGFFKERRFELIKENVEEIQKIFTKWRVKLAKYVDQHFVRISGNVEHLDEAEIIGLGETHIVDAHRVRNAKVIDDLAAPNDLILVEHDERREFRSDQAQFVQSGLQIYGWDDRSGESDDAAGRMNTAATAGALALPLIFVFPPLGIGLAASSFGYFCSQGKRDGKIIDQELPMRNENMCRTIDKCRENGRKIYVIAGSAHFEPSETSQEQQKMYELTINYLKDKKHVLLVPKKRMS